MKDKNTDKYTTNNFTLKRLLETSINVLFNIIYAPNPKIIAPFVHFEIIEEEFQISKFTLSLEYGEHQWKIQKRKIKLLQFCNFLEKNGIIIESYKNLRNIFNVTARDVNNIVYEIFNNPNLFKVRDVLLFFRISELSFHGNKMYEEKFRIMILNISNSNTCCGCLNFSNGSYQSLYVICKKTHFLIYDYKNKREAFKVVLYNKDLVFKMTENSIFAKLFVGDCNHKYHITSLSHHRVKELFQEINGAMELYNDTSISYAPYRYNNICNFFIDGKDYYEDLYRSIRKAKNEIFIAGWWIHPKVLLKRGTKKRKAYRLDCILKKKARLGVKIYILMYKEIEFTLSINSTYSINVLSNLHPNITVLRHPNTSPNNMTYWSHHEKMVIIDQNIVYVGGIDLCLGRYDTSEHMLFEKQQEENTNTNGLYSLKKNLSSYHINLEGFIWPGMDFSNPLKKDFVDIEKVDKTLIDRGNIPRMPWHDIQMKIIGDTAFDLSLHFIQRWNFITNKKLLIPNEIYFVDKSINIYPFVKCLALRSVSLWSINRQTENSVYKMYIDIIKNSKKYLYIENQFLITKFFKSDNQGPINCIGLELLKKIKDMHRLKKNFKIYILLPLLPAFELDLSLQRKSVISEIIKIQTSCINLFINELQKEGINYKDFVVFLSLQQYQKVNGFANKIEFEQIYVHSKIIVADGNRMVIGSANINDRSMLGERDSEVCVYVEDKDSDQIKSLVWRLLHEHLGFLKIKKNRKKYKHLYKMLNSKFIDLSDDKFFKTVCNIAEKNTEIYRNVFNCAINNDIVNLKLYFEIIKRDKNVKEEDCANIIGHIILYPHKFLIEENFESSYLGLDKIIPETIYL